MKIKLGRLVFEGIITIAGIIYAIQIIFFKRYDIGMSILFILYGIVRGWSYLLLKTEHEQ